MSLTPSPAQSAAFTALGQFLTGILPAGTEIVQGQVNRVPEPRSANFVAMVPLFRNRLATNEDSYGDVSFTGSIAATVMTVTAVAFGVIEVGQTVFGVDVADNTLITALGTGTGGTGTYVVSPGQTIASRKLASGGEYLRQATDWVVQLDVHGPAGSDNAQTIATLFRDEYGTRRFAELGDVVTPLYIDEPKQIPFSNGEKQYEDRWVLTCHMQINPVIRATMQFADQLEPTLFPVEANYPA